PGRPPCPAPARKLAAAEAQAAPKSENGDWWSGSSCALEYSGAFSTPFASACGRLAVSKKETALRMGQGGPIQVGRLLRAERVSETSSVPETHPSRRDGRPPPWRAVSRGRKRPRRRRNGRRHTRRCRSSCSSRHELRDARSRHGPSPARHGSPPRGGTRSRAYWSC